MRVRCACPISASASSIIDVHVQDDGQPCGFKHRREPAARNKTAVSAKGAQAGTAPYASRTTRASQDQTRRWDQQWNKRLINDEHVAGRPRELQASWPLGMFGSSDGHGLHANCKLMANCRAMHAADWQRHPPDGVQVQSSQRCLRSRRFSLPIPVPEVNQIEQIDGTPMYSSLACSPEADHLEANRRTFQVLNRNRMVIGRLRGGISQRERAKRGNWQAT